MIPLRGPVLACFLGLACLTAAPRAAAETLVAPRDAAAQPYRALAETHQIRNEILYSDRFDPNAEAAPPTATRKTRSGAPMIDGSGGIIAVLVVMAVLLFFVLRFGGGGMILSGAPKELKPRATAPEGWQIEDSSGGPGLLDRIAAMPDRRAALVQLLRHALLHAAQISDTRFARSDTERSALLRLPAALVEASGLERLARTTELAHYGGREITEAQFAECLGIARALLARGGIAHA